MLGALWLVLASMLQMGPGAGGPGLGGLPFGPDNFIITALPAQPDAPAGAACFVRLDVDLDQTQHVVVRAFGLPEGGYDVVLVHGTEITELGSFAAGADGLGKLQPAPPVTGDFLSWFAHRDRIEIRQEGVVLFNGQLDTPFFFLLGGDGPMLASVRLIAVGDDLDARGRLLSKRDSDGEYTTELRLERVAPGPYILELDDQPALYVVAGDGGKASVRLTYPVQPGTGLLTVFVVGTDVRVRDAAGHVVLQAQMPTYSDWHTGSLHHPARKQKFRDVGDGAADGLQVDFVRSGGTLAGTIKRGSVAWRRDALGSATLTLDLKGHLVTGPPYGVFVGDTLVGEFAVPDGGNDLPFSATLDVGPELDLRGQRVEVRQSLYEPLALYFPQSVPAGVLAYRKELRGSHRLRLDLLNPGTDLDATGRLDWRSKKGVERLLIDVRDLPAGTYDLAIDGTVVATDALLVAEDGGDASVLFSNAGLPDSQPLEFAVHGALEIRAAGTDTVYLLQSLAH